MTNDIRLLIPENARNEFLEQLEASSKALQKYENDTTPEGTKQFYHHAEIIKNIKARIQILEDGQKDMQRIQNDITMRM